MDSPLFFVVYGILAVVFFIGSAWYQSTEDDFDVDLGDAMQWLVASMFWPISLLAIGSLVAGHAWLAMFNWIRTKRYSKNGGLHD
jgi:hypothetical protein